MARGLPFADLFKCSDTIITQNLPNGNTFQQDFFEFAEWLWQNLSVDTA